ncbi:MAG: extracellular solute-binding protein, partial [Nocardioides sp.]
MSTPPIAGSRLAVGRRAAVAGSLAAVLSGCRGGSPPSSSTGSGGPASATTSAAEGASQGATAGPLRWANWPAYIDRRGGQRPTLDRFVAQSGIEVDYAVPIKDNAAFLDTVGDRLAARADIGYDLITLTTWAAARLVADGNVQAFGPIEHGDRVISALASPPWDPEQRFAMPWQAGLTGIAYDARSVDRAIGSVAELVERRDLAGRVGLLTEWNDTLGMVLLAQGRDLADLSADLIRESLDYVRERAAAGQFRGYYGNEYLGALHRGELAACLAWSGDILQAQLSNPYLKFVVPEEGLLIWSDDLLVPAASTRSAEVAALVDYY